MIMQQGRSRYCSVPINNWMREQLDVLEKFIVENVPTKITTEMRGDWQPTSDLDSGYKPLWGGDTMFFTISNWCQFLYLNANNNYEVIPDDMKLIPADYTIQVEIPYVYVGLHKDGALFSLVSRIIQVVMKSSDLLGFNTDSQLPILGTNTPILLDPPAIDNAGKKRKKRKNKEAIAAI